MYIKTERSICLFRHRRNLSNSNLIFNFFCCFYLGSNTDHRLFWAHIYVCVFISMCFSVFLFRYFWFSLEFPLEHLSWLQMPDNDTLISNKRSNVVLLWTTRFCLMETKRKEKRRQLVIIFRPLQSSIMINYS